MINELILPSKIHNTEQDVERDLRNWVQEDAKHFVVQIANAVTIDIDNKIERNCIRASHCKYHTQIMDLLRWWRSTLRTEINYLVYSDIDNFTKKGDFLCYETEIGEFVCSLQNSSEKPILFIEKINYYPISKVCFNGKSYKVKLTEHQLFNIIKESIYYRQKKKEIVQNNTTQKHIITENKQHNTMNNTKKRIRLTESQLIQIIREAVDEWSADDETWRCKYDPNYDCSDKSPIGQHIDKHYDYNTADAVYGIGGQKRRQRAEAAGVRDELADKERYFKSNPNARMNDGGPHFFATLNGQH